MLIASNSLTVYDATDDILSGDTAPAVPVKGMLWLNTATAPCKLMRYSGTEWVDCGVDQAIVQTLKDQYDALQEELVKTKEDLNQNLLDRVSGCVTQADYETYKASQHEIIEGLGTRITETLSGVTEDFGGLTQDYEEIHKLIYRGANGIIVGEKDSPFQVQIDNDRIDFLKDGVPVAYLSNNRLCITGAKVEQRMRMGGFVWDKLADGSLGLSYEEEGTQG